MITSPRPLLVTNTTLAPRRCGQWTLPPDQPVAVPMEFLEVYGGARGLVFDFSGVQDMLRTHDGAGRTTFDFHCPLSVLDGYGRHALTIWRGLQEIGAAPVLRDVEWRDALHLPPHVAAEAQANSARLPTRVGVVMSVPYDRHLLDHGSVYKVGITQFETDHVPAFHVRQVNRLDHLIVTSHFQPEVWRRSGVRRDLPISVLTAGVDTEFYGQRERPPGDRFRVLMLGALTGRKDPIGAVRAFHAASAGDESWRLTIKTRRADGVLLLLDALGIRHAKGELPGYPWRGTAPIDPRVEVVICDDSPEVVRQRYRDHDAFLWPSKGEGCGLPPLEAMATGMDVVMSNNSGMADYAFPEHCWPVGTAGMEPADIPGGFSRHYVDTYGSVGQWWVPDAGQLVKQLRRCHDAWAKGRGKGAKAAQYVRAHHTLAHQARSVLEVVERYA